MCITWQSMARSRKTAFGDSLAHCFGTVLRERRTAADMSQYTLAMKAVLDRRYVQLLENGTSQPSLETVFRLSHALNVEISDLMARTESLMLEKVASATGFSGNVQSVRAQSPLASSKMSRRVKRADAKRSDGGNA
jgi:transcriptional regulator with XRE-family HTH domain